ncbi:MAG TPA: glycosyltransferase family 61 protein [Chthoniobacterales bacterium]|nr:glycosyltransferase family 61 protein [Chthoniobacterales bacterium]
MGRIIDGEWYTAKQVVAELHSQAAVVLRPVLVHEFRSVFLVDGSVYLGQTIRLELRSEALRGNFFRRASVLPIAPQVECSEAILTSGIAGSTWFGHWLVDELPLQMLAAHFAPPISHLRSEHRDEPNYRAMLGLPTPKKVGTAFVSKLTVIDEFAQNPSKAKRYWRIRERLALNPKGAERVFLSRGDWGTARVLRNEQELLDRFEVEGYSILDLSKASFTDLLRVLSGASVVVSVEGSHLTHALYAMADLGTIIILNPPARTLTTVAGIAPFCKLFAGMFICSSNEDGTFSADADEVLSFIDATLDDNRARRGDLNRFLDSLSQSPVAAPVWSVG